MFIYAHISIVVSIWKIAIENSSEEFSICFTPWHNSVINPTLWHLIFRYRQESLIPSDQRWSIICHQLFVIVIILIWVYWTNRCKRLSREKEWMHLFGFGRVCSKGGLIKAFVWIRILLVTFDCICSYPVSKVNQPLTTTWFLVTLNTTQSKDACAIKVWGEKNNQNVSYSHTIILWCIIIIYGTTYLPIANDVETCHVKNIS